jgi:hypothetical protein
MDKKIIALAGAKTVGKTTMAESLNSFLHNSEIMSFATPIKDMLIAMGVPNDSVKGDKKEVIIQEIGQSGRDLMQSLGTEWGRKTVDQNIWVYALHKKILKSKKDTIIIDDCRFENEAQWVKACGGIVFQLTRDGIECDCKHSSEEPLGFGYFDKIIELDDSEKALFAIIETLKANQIC